jgi:hypothetical protein
MCSFENKMICKRRETSAVCTSKKKRAKNNNTSSKIKKESKQKISIRHGQRARLPLTPRPLKKPPTPPSLAPTMGAPTSAAAPPTKPFTTEPAADVAPCIASRGFFVSNSSGIGAPSGGLLAGDSGLAGDGGLVPSPGMISKCDVLCCWG